MRFQSTRDADAKKYSSAEVIVKGLADDGGLFVPEYIPRLTISDIEDMTSLSYIELAARVLGLFLSDHTYDELYSDCSLAYGKTNFPSDVCELREICDDTYSLELWHGPTCAFKDVALTLMPHLLVRSMKKAGDERNALILVATSGDTGKAALEGYKDIEGIKLAVFYPKNGVSAVQKLQMATQTGDNLYACGVEGNFDDIQTAVKQIFSSPESALEISKQGYFLSSANSINFGRLAPQIVYYVKAYCDLVRGGIIALGDEINVCVPTGNFGNILAAYIAKLMGIPIKKLICASNSNNVLTDFFSSGRYDRNRQFYTTISPSMDILISSNLERLIYLISGPEKTARYMRSLSEVGYYQISDDEKDEIDRSFVGYCADEDRIRATIKKYYDRYGYLMDTHTAVAFSAIDDHRSQTGDRTKVVVASTASPYKFAADVYAALTGDTAEGSIEALRLLSELTKSEIPEPLRDIDKKKIRFSDCASKESIYERVMEFIK